MRVRLVGRRSGGARAGGDALQVDESVGIGRAGGLDIDLVEDPAAFVPAAGDVVHLFNLQRCHDWGDLPERASAAGARVLITPLWHSVRRYHREGRRGLDGLAAKVLPSDVLAGLRWGRPGVRSRAAEVLGRADLVLLAHEGEAELLREELGVALESSRQVVVPVAIHGSVGSPGAVSAEAPAEGLALCVGRLEPLKNPVAVAAAAERAGVPVRFIGAYAGPRHAGYARSIRRSPSWLGERPYAEVRGLMGAARVHVLASWTEVVGRVTLEAALAGASVVLTDVGFAPDYLGRGTDGVFVVPAGDDAALAEALGAAWRRGRSPDSPLARRVRERFAWEVVGPRLLEAWSS